MGERTHYNFSSSFIESVLFVHIGQDARYHWWLEKIVCPACRQYILILTHSDNAVEIFGIQGRHHVPDEATEQRIRIWPRHTGRPPVPPEVPDKFKTDYQQACLVLMDSPNASAALGRRCLQLILREKLGAKGRNLHEEVQWAITSSNLPSSVLGLLDVPRQVGNRGAHPMLSSTGEIVEVEPGEAEWCLEVIEALYDYLFVLPAKTQERLGRLGQK